MSVPSLTGSDPLLESWQVERPRGLRDPSFSIDEVSVFVYRSPIAHPVVTSFGIMHDRPAVLVRVRDAGGALGWGEVWCNFPACGAEHRARLVETVLAPLLTGRVFSDPADATLALERAVYTLALQTAEWGPLAQALAGVDIALWDLVCRREGVPLYQALGGQRDRVPAYASGINPGDAVASIERCRAGGDRVYKVKVGFGEAADLAAVGAAAACLQPGEQLMLDANQAWDLETARRMAEQLARFEPVWLEEPLAADRPLQEWLALRAASPIPLAGGENLRGLPHFQQAIDQQLFAVVQPDVCKWGGISGCTPVAWATLRQGLRYCPHFLGAGIGLLASAHLLAAVGGDGLLEIDSNPNPLRDELCPPALTRVDGMARLPSGPGLGAVPDLDHARRWQVSLR